MEFKSKGTAGQGYEQLKAIALKLVDSESQTLADAAAGAYLFTEATGLFFVTAGTSTAIFALYDAAGTPTTVLLAGAAATFTITKDTVSRINVYYETGALNVQNNSGGQLAISVKAIL